MSDLVEHLRREASKQDMLICEDMLQAADEIVRLRAALTDIVSDVLEYERINNLAPNPGRTHCWDSVARAQNILNGTAEG